MPVSQLFTLMVDWMPCSSWGTCPYASVSHQQPSIPDGGGMPFSPQAYTIILISPMLLALFFDGAGKWIQGLMHAKQALFLWTLRSTLTWLHFPQSLVSLHALVSATNWAILLWLMNLCVLGKKKIHVLWQRPTHVLFIHNMKITWKPTMRYMVFVCITSDDTKLFKKWLHSAA